MDDMAHKVHKVQKSRPTISFKHNDAGAYFISNTMNAGAAEVRCLNRS